MPILYLLSSHGLTLVLRKVVLYQEDAIRSLCLFPLEPLKSSDVEFQELPHIGRIL